MSRALRILRVVMTLVAVAVLAGTAALVWTMDAGSASQGGRVYVSIGGLLALGFVVQTILNVARRGDGPHRTHGGLIRHDSVIALGVMFGATVFLVLVAVLSG